MRKLHDIILTVLFLLGSGNLIFSQQLQVRPKIGLALSGGGSLGIAHVGVLKVMEEAGLRPDYITGVSMGSIVGAMYSIGYKADSLQALFKNSDWDLILSNNIPENKVVFTEKKYFNNSIMSLPVSTRKLQLPSGLITGQQIEKMLSYYAWPAADINDFSRLPIPFLCLGTDLITCKKVELKRGYLPDAIRASMAVPSIFTPVKIDTAILIDGGFIRNIAASELKEMGADIIIGSYTGFKRYNESELHSVTGIIKQLSFFNTVNDYNQQKQLIDILIEPKVKDLSPTVFTNSDSIVKRGYIAALPFREKFRRLADSLNNISVQEPVKSLLGNQSYFFDRIEIEGNKIIPDNQILGILDIGSGEKISRDILSDKIDLLYGQSWFDKVSYRIVPGNDSLKLVISCVEKPQSILYGSVHYDNSLRAGVIIDLSVKNILTPKSTININAYIGQFFRANFNYTQFIDRNQKMGLSAIFKTENTLIPVMQIGEEIGETIIRNYYTGINLNKRIGLNCLVAISESVEMVTFIPDFISEGNLEKVSYNSLMTNFSNQVNTINNKHFPDKGTILNLSVSTSKLLSGKVRTKTLHKTYTQEDPGSFQFQRSYTFTGNLKNFFSPGRLLTFEAGGDFLITYSGDSITSPQNFYYAGGVESNFTRSIPLTGFHPGEIAVDRFTGIRFNADIEFHENLHLGLLAGLAYVRETGQSNNYTLLGGFGIGLGYMSIIGPIKIGIMNGLSSSERYFKAVKGFISIGYCF